MVTCSRIHVKGKIGLIFLLPPGLDRAEDSRARVGFVAYAPTIPTHRVTARAREVADYHYDDAKPGKPLRLLIPGGLVAIASFISMGMVGYGEWVQGGISSPEGQLWIALLLIPYFGGLFVFFYGYELYDLGRAIKLTLIAGVAGISILAVGWAVFAALGALGKGSSHSSSSSSSSSSGSSGSSSFGASSPFGGGGSSSGSWSPSSSHGHVNLRGVAQLLSSDDGSPISLNLSGPSGTVAECPVCGYALPGGAGSPCPYCAYQAKTMHAKPAGTPALAPCPKCGQPITAGDSSECPHMGALSGQPS